MTFVFTARRLTNGLRLVACVPFNKFNFKEYLSVTFAVITKGASTPPNFHSIHLCCAHFIKFVCKDIDRHRKK